MSSRHRRYFSPEAKMAIVRRNLLDGLTEMEVCKAKKLNRSVLRRWKTQLLQNGASAFRRRAGKPDQGQNAAAQGNGKPHAHHDRPFEDALISIIRPNADVADIVKRANGQLCRDQVASLISCIREKPIKYRNRAIAILLHHMKIRVSKIAKFLGVSHSSVDTWILKLNEHGIAFLLEPRTAAYRKMKDPEYVAAVFAILHCPPCAFGVNRTTWRLGDIHKQMALQGRPIARSSIGAIIREAGFRYRKAKTVLTSTDPNYRRKLQKITQILANLGPNEKFFSVDEFGPFAVKKRGGRSLVPRGHVKTVPQRQQSKGCLIVTGALELATNQVTHFYSNKKNTAEMIKLLDILVDQYANQRRIYFSWDAASWHASRALYAHVRRLNSSSGKKKPVVKLAPLPSSAQFLNVIESVFSGMARAVLHNSDYCSVEACKSAIDRHFAERNRYFTDHPSRAGNKIWGKERVPPRFSNSNNCKDPRYR